MSLTKQIENHLLKQGAPPEYAQAKARAVALRYQPPARPAAPSKPSPTPGASSLLTKTPG